MSTNMTLYDDEQYVDVNSLPLKPPQALLAPERAVRRPWHPVMWDNSVDALPNQDHLEKDQEQVHTNEYPHKQRIRNLRRLIAEGKVKPTSETLIFFLCNKFAVSDDRETRVLT